MPVVPQSHNVESPAISYPVASCHIWLCRRLPLGILWYSSSYFLDLNLLEVAKESVLSHRRISRKVKRVARTVSCSKIPNRLTLDDVEVRGLRERRVLL